MFIIFCLYAVGSGTVLQKSYWVLIGFWTPIQCEILHTNFANYNTSMLCLPDSVPLSCCNCMKIWRHPQYWKYITYCIVPEECRAMTTVNMHRRWSLAVWFSTLCEPMDRQTNRQIGSTCSSQLLCTHPGRGGDGTEPTQIHVYVGVTLTRRKTY